MEIFFPQDKFLHGKFPPHSPLFLTPPPNQKIPLKTSLHFPITINICKHCSKFANCSPSHGNCGGVSHPQRHSYKVFRLCWIKCLSQNFDPTTLGKNERGRGPRCPPIFCSLKKGTRTFHFRSNVPSRKILRPLGRYNHPWEKEKKTNKHASVICLLAKNTEFHIFVDRILELVQEGSLIRWIWWWDFHYDSITFRGCFTLFSKIGQIFPGS